MTLIQEQIIKINGRMEKLMDIVFIFGPIKKIWRIMEIKRMNWKGKYNSSEEDITKDNINMMKKVEILLDERIFDEFWKNFKYNG